MTHEYIQTGLLAAILIYLIAQNSSRLQLGRKKYETITDSSALIDGRILAVMDAGFITGRVGVPQFIVRELQLLADGNDSHKRERARFGLDMVHELQSLFPGRVDVIAIEPETRLTDDKLVALAKQLGSSLCTTDYNLNKVAKIEDVRVLNLNELAQALRPTALPGEHHEVKIIQKGSSRDQGVGYLEDGTMVVVSGAGSMLNKQVKVSVTRMLQTEAGKMIFANLSEPKKPVVEAAAKQPRRRRPQPRKQIIS